jgi:hypothetical protein
MKAVITFPILYLLVKHLEHCRRHELAIKTIIPKNKLKLTFSITFFPRQGISNAVTWIYHHAEKLLIH